MRAHDGETEITGPIIDQSHLHGLLHRIAALGLTLRSLSPIETENARADAPTRTSRGQRPQPWHYSEGTVNS